MRHTGMRLQDIRNMNYNDFQIHLRLALVAEHVDREFRMALQGVETNRRKKKQPPRANEVMSKLQGGGKFVQKGSGKKTFMRRQKFDPTVGNFVDI